MISGSLLINKEIGLTSRQEVNNVSRRLNEKKAGHIGTLDPFADGLLIVLFGKSTKISPFLEVMDKTYMATLKLGKKTDSGDCTGNVIDEAKIPQLTREKINEILNTFLGEQTQIPPMYSAIKKDGKELYKYAREGIEIDREARKINIFDIKLMSFEKDELVFVAKVSKGTYIRTLGEDIAVKLGTVGHLTKLTRLAVGEFSLNDAKRSSEVTENDLISNEKMLAHFPAYKADERVAKMALNGMHFRLPITDEKVLIKDKDGIIALYEREPSGVYSCLRGLRWKRF